MSKRKNDIKLLHDVIQNTLFSSLNKIIDVKNEMVELLKEMQDDLVFDTSIQEDLENIKHDLNGVGISAYHETNKQNLFRLWYKLSSQLKTENY